MINMKIKYANRVNIKEKKVNKMVDTEKIMHNLGGDFLRTTCKLDAGKICDKCGRCGQLLQKQCIINPNRLCKQCGYCGRF